LALSFGLAARIASPNTATLLHLLDVALWYAHTVVSGTAIITFLAAPLLDSILVVSRRDQAPWHERM